jgi:hypothetical protein
MPAMEGENVWTILATEGYILGDAAESKDNGAVGHEEKSS